MSASFGMRGTPDLGANASGSRETHYTQTGMSDMNGGYAYPPGSEMCVFVDGINSQVAKVCRSPDGHGSVADWAKRLAANQVKNASGGMAGNGLGNGQNPATNLKTLLIQFLQLFEKLMGQGGASGRPSPGTTS
jgi:hypothetical protein